MFYAVGVILAVCLWNTVSSTGIQCTFVDICERNMTLGPPCGVLFQCPTVTISRPCMLMDDCTEFYGSWSTCSESCGGGIRTRIGRCCSPRCTRVLEDTENCNVDPCTL